MRPSGLRRRGTLQGRRARVGSAIRPLIKVPQTNGADPR
jgi:hypothetical protein